MKYAKQRKEAVLRKMLPPSNRTIQEIAAEKGISVATLYLWRKAARCEGRLLPDGEDPPRTSGFTPSATTPSPLASGYIRRAFREPPSLPPSCVSTDLPAATRRSSVAFVLRVVIPEPLLPSNAGPFYQTSCRYWVFEAPKSFAVSL